MRLLEVRGVTKTFGGLMALMSMDLVVTEGKIKAVIGPNGAGKTTLFNLITGFYPPDEGRIFFRGEDITGHPPERLAHLGIGRTFQLVRPFLNMTLLENVMVAALSRTSDMREARRKALDVIEFLRLDGKLEVAIGALTLEDRKRLELARALALLPSLLLLDEVMAGLNPAESNEMIELIRKIRDRGTTIVLIEHVMHAVLSLSDEVVVLNYGEKIYDGTSENVVSDQRVIEAYLGEEYSFA